MLCCFYISLLKLEFHFVFTGLKIVRLPYIPIAVCTGLFPRMYTLHASKPHAENGTFFPMNLYIHIHMLVIWIGIKERSSRELHSRFYGIRSSYAYLYNILHSLCNIFVIFYLFLLFVMHLYSLHGSALFLSLLFHSFARSVVLYCYLRAHLLFMFSSTVTH